MNFKIEKDNTILILMPYYNRPEIVKNALSSIKNQSYKNWKLAFIDDGSDEPGKNIVTDFFDEENLSKTKFYNTNDTKEIKLQRKKDYQTKNPEMKDRNLGTFFTPLCNQAMNDFDFDIAFMLCDDDLLCDNYLENLNNYYKFNPETMYSYCNLILFDRRVQQPKDSNVLNHRFTRIGKVRGYFNLDTSQVSWRGEIFKKYNVKFNENFHPFFDADWYETLYKNFGLCEPNHIIGQYKDFDRFIFNL